MNERDKAYMKRLREADEALYQLWKKCSVDSPLFHAINNLQKDFIHPEIQRIEGKAA